MQPFTRHSTAQHLFGLLELCSVQVNANMFFRRSSPSADPPSTSRSARQRLVFTLGQAIA